MAYPSIDQYQRALQHPRTAFKDPQLKQGRIRSSGIGLPLVASGGFALTYALDAGAVRYAVRCFHREAAGIERRYAGISARLKALSSKYFVDFDFQHSGVQIDGGAFPLVKMAWAEGETLGEFVESNYRDKSSLQNLISSLSALSGYLETAGISHGDIQEGNLMVAEGGRKLQLIDYDGMFVPEVAAMGGTELGHRDYQHPKRSIVHFGPRLDRFSFISLNLALRALCAKPELWGSSQSGAGVIVFRANDFASPNQSAVLAEIASIPGMARDVANFTAICVAEFSSIPALTDFIGGANIPAVTVSPNANQSGRGNYISPYPVLHAKDYDAFYAHIGATVELVGQVVEVAEKSNRYGTYMFVNFAPWRGKAVKINVWSAALKRAREKPSNSWVGQWVTIRGLVEPVYPNPKYNYFHISISAATVDHIRKISAQEAQYRLAPAGPAPRNEKTPSNSDALQMMKAASSKVTPAQSVVATPAPKLVTVAPAKPAITANQAALQRMRQQATPPLPVPPQASMPSKTPPSAVPSNPNRASTHATVSGTGSSIQRQNYATRKSQRGLLEWLKSLFS